jgi:superfamily I DNA and/or RNA helicase
VGTSYVNVFEANRICQLVEEMMKKFVRSNDVTVLTLYDEQKKLICRQLDSSNIEV